MRPLLERSWPIVTAVGITVGLCAAAAALTQLALQDARYAAAAAYAVLFMILAWKRPELALLVIFAAAPFQSDVAGGGFANISIAEGSLMLALPVFLVQNLVRKRPISAGPITIPVILYFAVCIFSSAVTWRGHDAVISMLQMVLYFFIAVMIFASFAPDETKLLLPLAGLVWICVFLSFAAIATSFTFMGLNKNGIGASLSCGFLVSLELWLRASAYREKLRLTLSMLAIGAGLVLSLSRGAWLGAATGFLFLLLFRGDFRMALRSALILVPLVAVCWLALPRESKDYAVGFSSDRLNIQARYKSANFTEAEWKQSPIYGVGVGLRKEYDATDLVFMTLAETGVLGLAGLLAIYAVLMHMIWRTRRSYEPHEVESTLLAAAGSLVLCQLAHGMVDHYWSRGVITTAWGGAGMATGAYYKAKLRAARSYRSL